MPDCIFCKIISKDFSSHTIYEDEKTICIMDIQPLTRGHLLVMPKAHACQLADMEDEHIEALMRTVKKMARVIIDVMKPDGYNVFQNNGRAAGQVVDHVHFHIVPRISGDGVLNPKHKPRADEDELKAVAEQLRARLKG